MATKTDRESPIVASDSYYNSNSNYNEKLDPQHLDINPNDESVGAQLIRGIASLVGGLFSPKRLIVVFRLLKALTFCCLCLTIAAELIYLFVVALQVSSDVSKKIGGLRDTILRFYGVALAVVAIFVELEMKIVDNNCPMMKSYIPRSLLLLFITTVSGTTPIIGYENRLFSKYRNRKYDDDEVSSSYLYYTEDNALIANEVPGSAVAFQAATTFILFITACLYFIMGIMCLDRFTSDAFLSNDDPVSGTSLRSCRYDRDDETDEGTYDTEYDRHDRVNPGRMQHSYSEDSGDVR